jgi:hypothetical protein
LALSRRNFPFSLAKKTRRYTQKKLLQYVWEGKKINMEIICCFALCWLLALRMAQCKARWRSDSQQNGGAALMGSVNIVTMKT